MHIAYLIPTIDRIGGAERQLILLAKGMRQRGWCVTLIALSGVGADAIVDLRANEVSFLSLEMRKGLLDPRGWVRLHHWLVLHKPDIVHAHLPHAALLARWSRLAAPMSVLIETIHSPAIGGPARKLAYQMSSWLPDIVTAVSAPAAKPWVDARMVRQTSLQIMPNGIDFNYWRRDDQFRDIARRNHRFNEEFVWVAVGRLDLVKEHSTLLHAFSRLPCTAHLLIAGTGALEVNLRRLARDLHIAGRVTFLGFQKDILHCIRQADAFVLNSRWEGLPVALMEACACELPVVFTDTPGAREVLPDPPVTPVPIGDADALAARMISVMSMPGAERSRIGALERQSISARLDVATMLSSYDALYRGTLVNNSRPLRWASSCSRLPGVSAPNIAGK